MVHFIHVSIRVLEISEKCFRKAIFMVLKHSENLLEVLKGFSAHYVGGIVKSELS